MNNVKYVIILASMIMGACQPQTDVGNGGKASSTSDDRLTSRSGDEYLSGSGHSSSSVRVLERNTESCSVAGDSEAAFICPSGLNSFETWLPFGDVDVFDGGFGESAIADVIEFRDGSSLIGYVRFQEISSGSTIAVSISAESDNSETLALTVVEGCSSLDSPSGTGFISFEESGLGSASVEVVAGERLDCFTVLLNPLIYPATFSVWNLQHSIE